jgi:hypothetical protein
MLRQFTAQNKSAQTSRKARSLIPPLKHTHHQHELATPKRVLQPRGVIASDAGVTPIIPLDSADEAVLRYVRELAKRLAREDHEAEIAARQASDSARTKSP